MMNILYTCDNNYVWLMGISIISLFENNKGMKDIYVWLLGEKISEENKCVLKEIGERYNRAISVIDVKQINIPQSLVSGRWPLSAYTRLFSGNLLPKTLDTILYLDCDTIISGSLEELENWDVSGAAFWGIKDCIGKEYKKNIGLDPDGTYVNAGVLLINLRRLREIQVEDKLDSYMKEYEKKINYADQDVLNGSFRGSIGVLPPQYDVMTIVASYSYEEIMILRKPTNYYSADEIKAAVKDPAIIHYTTNMLIIRPWFSNSNHLLKDEFRKYMLLSPWKEKKLDEMTFSTKESKIIEKVEKLPRGMAIRVLGLFHSTVKPAAIKLKSRKG